MLVLSRRPTEKIVFPSIPATIEVLRIEGNRVRFGINAPRDVPVAREEILAGSGAWEPSPREPVAPAEVPAVRQGNHFIRNQLNTTTIGLALLRRQVQVGLLDKAQATLAKLETELRGALEQWTAGAGSPACQPKRSVPKALLVEDNQNELELLAGFLRLAGFDVATAGDGADALDYLSSQGRPDVLLLDMLMPRCDGPTTVRSIRSNPDYTGLKIFAVSGISPGDARLELGPAGVDRWFSKPIDPNTLVKALKRELCAAGV